MDTTLQQAQIKFKKSPKGFIQSKQAIRTVPSQNNYWKIYTQTLTTSDDLGATKNYEIDKISTTIEDVYLVVEFSAVTGGTSNQSLVEGSFIFSRISTHLSGTEISATTDVELYDQIVSRNSPMEMRDAYIMDVADRRTANVTSQRVVLNISTVFNAYNGLTTNAIFNGSGKVMNFRVPWRSVANICQASASGASVSMTSAKLVIHGHHLTEANEHLLGEMIKSSNLRNHYIQGISINDSTISTTGTS